MYKQPPIRLDARLKPIICNY